MNERLKNIEDSIFASSIAQVTAWTMFVGGIIGWPVTALSIFKHEPQGILGLSWVAIIYGGYQVLQQIYTNRLVEESNG